MKRCLLIILVSLLFLPISAAFQNRNMTIIFIPKSSDQVYWDFMRVGVDEALKEIGSINLTWRGPSSNSSIDAQIKILQNYTRAGVDAIVIAPTDRERLIEPVGNAVKLGIKVIVIDSSLGGVAYSRFIATDNYAAGQLAAKRLSETLKGRGNIIVLRTVIGSASTEDRANGFVDYIKLNSRGMTIVADHYGGGSRGECMHSAIQLLTATKNVDGVFAVNESSSDGILRALRETGLAGKVQLVGFDSTDFLLDGLEKRDIDALVIQNPQQIGYLSIKAAVAAIQNAPIKEKTVFTKAIVATRDNYQSPDIMKLMCVHCL